MSITATVSIDPKGNTVGKRTLEIARDGCMSLSPRYPSSSKKGHCRGQTHLGAVILMSIAAAMSIDILGSAHSSRGPTMMGDG